MVVSPIVFLTVSILFIFLTKWLKRNILNEIWGILLYTFIHVMTFSFYMSITINGHFLYLILMEDSLVRLWTLFLTIYYLFSFPHQKKEEPHW